MRFLRWFFGLFLSYDKQKLLAAHRRPQCACPTDEEGLMRCEGLADPDCRGGCCLIHCRKLCGDRCKPALAPAALAGRRLQQCSSKRSTHSQYRCPAIEDARCKGGNCTEHCREHCGGACLKLRAV